mgnify:CR=1 FL=1
MNKTIDDYFEFYKNSSTDINEHFDCLRKYSQECNVVIEMGVRAINSTWAFLKGQPKKLVSIDFQHPNSFDSNLDEVFKISKSLGVDYEFRLQNTLDCEIEECDLLFIDTWHDYLQLKMELFRHNNKVKKYIILHDTTSYAFKNENDYEDYNQTRKETNLPKGLVPAVNEFIQSNPNWFIYEKFANNNGITILKKK